MTTAGAIAEASDLGLGLRHVQLLGMVCAAGPEGLASGVIQTELGISPDQLSRMVQKLVVAGLVVRADDPDDRRALRLTPTDAGTALEGRIRAMFAAWRHPRLDEGHAA